MDRSQTDLLPRRSGAAAETGEQRLLRVALIGGGKMGVHHLKAIQASGLATVVGVADPAADREALQAVLPPGALIVPSANELLERTRPDVVHVVTPPSTHRDLARLALGAGCHVYVEKPFTPKRAEAEEILNLAAERGLRVCAGHQVMFETPALATRASLVAIGRLVHVESYFSFKTVRRTISPVEQVKDILPHAVYPIVDQLRAGTGQHDPLELVGASVDPSGEVYALVRLGRATAVILVTLNGRPIEHYQHLVGTNGSLRADYITGSVTRLVGPGTGPGILFTPYRRAFRTVTGATRGFARLILRKGQAYEGLRMLVARFYEAIVRGMPSPISPESILDTVAICERLGDALDDAEREQESAARARLLRQQASLPPVRVEDGAVLVTGGTGLLGRRAAEELRGAGFQIRAVARRVPSYSRRLAGVEYAASDLSRGLDDSLLRGVSLVVHCAAETAGGRRDQQRNSIDATRNVVEAASRAGVRRMLHVSSLAILKSSREVGRPLDEDAPIDAGNMARGPYVWGKAESEMAAVGFGAELGVAVKVIRPGPLVDYAAYQPPGRLGRELGPVFVAVGPKNGPLSVCDVSTAASVIRSFAEDFDAAPQFLNLIEAPPPSRRELLARFVGERPDLQVIWLPHWVLRLMSAPLKLVQRVALGATQPFDIASAFASERYRTDLAAQMIERARTRAVPEPVGR